MILWWDWRWTGGAGYGGGSRQRRVPGKQTVQGPYLLVLKDSLMIRLVKIIGFEFFANCYTPIPYSFQKKILKNIKWNELWILECILLNLESLFMRYLSWLATLQIRSQFISFCSSFGVCRNALKEISQMNPAGLILG